MPGFQASVRLAAKETRLKRRGWQRFALQKGAYRKQIGQTRVATRQEGKKIGTPEMSLLHQIMRCALTFRPRPAMRIIRDDPNRYHTGVGTDGSDLL